MQEIGPQLRSIRFAKDIRVKDLAEAVGISEQSLLAIENGRVENPGFKTVARIAEELGLSLDYLHRGVPGFAPGEIEALRRHGALLHGLKDVLDVLVPKLAETHPDQGGA